jgi:hypothetical protein
MDPHATSDRPHMLSAVTLGRRFGTRRVARRVAAVDAYEFSASVRQRFRLKHPDLGIPSFTLIEAATHQWFRLHARRPKARLSMPSTVVDDLWHEMLLYTRDYAVFCDAAFGRFHPPTAPKACTGAAIESRPAAQGDPSPTGGRYGKETAIYRHGGRTPSTALPQEKKDADGGVPSSCSCDKWTDHCLCHRSYAGLSGDHHHPNRLHDRTFQRNLRGY